MEFQQSNYKIENIASIERLDDFDDEYVYDVEVDDTNGSMSGKYLQFTDINGMSAEVIVDANEDEESLYHSLKCGDIALDMDYLYIGARFDDSDEVSPIYINLKEKEKDGVSAE